MKDPAFLFYPGDWLGGTLGMTLEEKGAYLELLICQFNSGHMTSHMVGRMVGQVFGQIQDKFKKDENDLWYNKRLDIEIEKRNSFINSRKNNLKGFNQYKKERKDKKYTTTGEQATINNLYNKAGGSMDKAAEIINQSIQQNWAGLFAIKDHQNKEQVTDLAKTGRVLN